MAVTPKPSIKDYSGKTYWKWAASNLHAAYKGICAYTSFYMMPPGTIDHFIPKSRNPKLAYEWSNFRLAGHRVNTYKGDSIQVLDPFTIQSTWFVMDVPSCLIRPGDDLVEPELSQVQATIDVLRLNSDDTFVQERCDLMYAFANNEVGLDYLRRRYPFLAAQIVRHNIVTTAHLVFKTR